MEEGVKEWRRDGKYLPKFLRDFHDQKDIFKAIHQMTDVQGHEYAKDISWVAGQCYVIDIFLWCMARFGYTLQKTRTKLKFEDLHTVIQKCRDIRNRRGL